MTDAFALGLKPHLHFDFAALSPRDGKSCEIALGPVVGCFVREGVVDPENGRVDQRKMDAIGRLGGHGYSRIRDQFDLPTMLLAEWSRRDGG
jgi:hypothetical protein